MQELHIERALERGRVGNIYTGKVARVLPGMQSAFIDIGLERAAFLHIADVFYGNGTSRNDHSPGAAPPPPIERLVFEGQTLTVQVIKDPIGTKGARLSTQISDRRAAAGLPAAGRPHRHLAEDRLAGVARAAALRMRRCRSRGRAGRGGEAAAAASSCAPTPRRRATRSSPTTSATCARPGQAVRERALQVAAGNAAAPGPEPGASGCCATWSTTTPRRSGSTRGCSSRPARSSAASSRRRRRQAPALRRRAADLRPVRIDEEIAKALLRRVELKSGGYLIIDQTEALTTVDVNTGGFVGARNFDDTIFKTNLEAAQAIARQLRLRNLGGIIIIDFIDMAREEHRAAVLAELKKQLARDRTKVTVSGFTQLGLVEMTRKRTRESLAHMLCEPCPMCQGRGEVKTARSVCHDILREILREARQFNPKEFRVVASASVVEMLLDEESQHLAGAVATSSASRSRCAPSRSRRPSSTTSSCCEVSRVVRRAAPPPQRS